MNLVGRKVLQPCSCRIVQEQGEVANNEVITIRAVGLTSKPVVFVPQAGVRLPGVLRDVGRRSIPWRESHVEDVPIENLGPRQVRAWAPVFAAIVASTATRMVAVADLLSLVTPSTPAGVYGVACVTVGAETLMHQDLGEPPLSRGAWWTDTSWPCRPEDTR